MKAVFNRRPALPRTFVTWDADSVLNYLKSLSPVKDVTLKFLTWKLVMLILMLSGQRGQSVHLFDLRNISLTSSMASFRVGEPIKQSRPGYHLGEVAFKAYALDRRLCVVTVLKEYLKRTEPLRAGTSRLLITYQKPHHAASRDTIRRWTRETLIAAGIDMSIFKPHSTRSASTCSAKSKIPLSTILKTVGWSRESTFRNYYDKPVDRKFDFQSAVLDSRSKLREVSSSSD
jgi:hypothetical protein